MRHQPSLVSVVFLYGVLIVMLVLIRRAKRHPAGKNLEAKQRIRPIMVTWLDPFLGLAIVGAILWNLVSTDAFHAAAALFGAMAGTPIGIARANTQYVRAVPDARSVIFRRSGLEYGLLGLLVVRRVAEDAVARIHSVPFTLLLTWLVAFAVGESIARSVWITLKYNRESPVTSASSVE